MFGEVKIGIVGFGRMGRAIALGLSRAGIDKECIGVHDKLAEVVEEARSRMFKVFDNLRDLVMFSDVVVVAVKPKDVKEVVKSIEEVVKGKIIVSVAALVKMKVLEEAMPEAHVYRAMPNIAVEVNKGFIALTPRSRRSDVVENLFKLLGEVEWVDEEVLDMLTFYSASTPAIVVELFDAFMLSALKAGLPHDIAKKALSSVLQGVATLAQVKDVTTIRDSVITPRGVTIRAIEKIYTYGVKQLLIKALNDAFEEYNQLLQDGK